MPMINVALLLLVFFLMTATIAPPEPMEVDPPRADAEPAENDSDVLVVGADGSLALGDLRGRNVFSSLSGGPLRIKAAAELEGRVLARLIGELGARGVTEIEIVTAPR